MTDPSLPDPATDHGPQLPEAKPRRSRWIGLVWAVPLAALILVAFLGIRAFMNRGIDVVVTFNTGAGAHVDDTKVIYQGVEAGKVTKIEINEDGHRVDMTLRLDPRADLGLTTSTVFWLVGANPSINDISSVKAALAGVTIGVAPGTGGKPARRFVGLSEPPAIMPGTPGTPFVLTANSLGTAQAGSPIYFRGQQIGKVTGVRFTAPESFALDIFVLSPYDALVTSSSMFWISSPVQVSLAERGASATLEHAGALFNGAIEFDVRSGGSKSPGSVAGAQFPLYAQGADARSGPPGPEVPYTMRFTGPGGELSRGAPIRMMGFEIGEVREVHMQVDQASGETSTWVDAVLYPQKLKISVKDPGDWQHATDELVERLLAKGHRVRLVQTPPLIGGRAVTFDTVHAGGLKVATMGPARSLPSDDSSAGIDEITGQVNELLSRLNHIPLDEIGRQVQQLTARINGLVSSPQLAGSLQHLNDTLAQADRMMGEVSPKVGPLVDKLNRAADEITSTVGAAHGLIGNGSAAGSDASLPQAIEQLSDAARSIRALVDYLNRHPESLIRGRSADPPPALTKDAK